MKFNSICIVSVQSMFILYIYITILFINIYKNKLI